MIPWFIALLQEQKTYLLHRKTLIVRKNLFKPSVKSKGDPAFSVPVMEAAVFGFVQKLLFLC